MFDGASWFEYCELLVMIADVDSNSPHLSGHVSGGNGSVPSRDVPGVSDNTDAEHGQRA